MVEMQNERSIELTELKSSDVPASFERRVGFQKGRFFKRLILDDNFVIGLFVMTLGALFASLTTFLTFDPKINEDKFLLTMSIISVAIGIAVIIFGIYLSVHGCRRAIKMGSEPQLIQ